MKKYIIAIVAVAFMVSCGDESSSESTTTEIADPNAKIDPVCDMVKDDTWTEYSVSGTDTIWFCSGTCKEAYDTNPAKYAKK